MKKTPQKKNILKPEKYQTQINSLCPFHNVFLCGVFHFVSPYDFLHSLFLKDETGKKKARAKMDTGQFTGSWLSSPTAMFNRYSMMCHG